MNARPKRRFLFTMGGGYGHFHPLVPLARALKQRGHEVAFASGPSMQQPVEKAGFAFLLVGGPKMADDPQYRQFKAELEKMPLGLESELFAYPRIFCGVGTRLRTPSMVEIAREWRADMIIHEAESHSAVIAAELLGVPHATVAFAAALRTMAYFEREAARFLDPIRESFGLAPDPHMQAPYRYLHLAYSPPTFALHDVAGPGVQEMDAPIPATTHFVRAEVFDNPGDESLPGWVSGLRDNGQSVVYVTLGTEINDEPELYPGALQTIIEGLRDMPINLIVTLGRSKDPSDFGPQPPNVHIERYIPQSLLLSLCDLMVMHGGSNTVLAALDVGLPTVTVPLIADQFFNANVAQSLQLGQVVRRWELSPASIRTAVEEVQHNPSYRQNVERLQAEMHALPSQEYAVELVERVAAEGKPILNPQLTVIA